MVSVRHKGSMRRRYRDPKNIRNILEYGGGALMDIGCYGVYTSRLVFDEEPTRVLGLIEEDPEMRTDVVTSVMLHFRSGQCVFTCGTQLVPYQRVQILGTQGRIEVEIPLNAPPCDQYTIQGDLFSNLSGRDGAADMG